jgi:DNA-binding LytR/AlgR family response regulator
MRYLVIEDENLAAQRLQYLLRQADPQAEIVAVLRLVQDVREWLAAGPQAPDLILADIQLGDGLSFEIFENLPIMAPVIFTTSFDEYAIQAFKVRSIDYLLKPIKLDELQAALAKLREMQAYFSPPSTSRRLEALLDNLSANQGKYKTRFLVGNTAQLLPLDIAQVMYFQSRNEVTTCVADDNRRFAIDYTLDSLEKLLDPHQFFRASRQLLVHLRAVRRIHAHFNGKLKLELVPEPTEEALVSRDKAGLFKAWMES